jgi:hypothetical protein
LKNFISKNKQTSYYLSSPKNKKSPLLNFLFYKTQLTLISKFLEKIKISKTNKKIISNQKTKKNKKKNKKKN